MFGVECTNDIIIIIVYNLGKQSNIDLITTNAQVPDVIN